MDSFRIHPAIGVARVGNSEEYVIAPETMAGSPMPGRAPLTGGLPIRAGTDAEPVRSSDLRDASGALKRQAARFRAVDASPRPVRRAAVPGARRECVRQRAPLSRTGQW